MASCTQKFICLSWEISIACCSRDHPQWDYNTEVIAKKWQLKVHNFAKYYWIGNSLDEARTKFYQTMVTDLCHFVFSCLRPKRRMAMTRKHVFCHYFELRRHEDTTNKGRQHERFLPATRSFQQRNFRAFAC